MPNRSKLDHDLVLATYAELGENRLTARKLGINENTVLQIRRMAAGLCRSCGLQREDLSLSKCSRCREKYAVLAVNRRKQRQSDKICVQCNNPVSQKSESYCEHHLEHFRKKAKNDRKIMRNRLGEKAYKSRQRLNRIRASYGKAAIDILVETNHSCSICGETYKPRRIHIHHIDANHDNNSQENLVPLCVRCHKLTHELIRHPDPSKVIEWVQKTYGLP
jgi:5-methylcytosine-specific restriction endonuclease McrA